MKKRKLVLPVVAILIVTLSLLTFLLPIPRTWDEPTSVFYASLIETIMFSLLHIGGAILLLLGLDAFKTELKRAYRSIAVGIVLLGLALLQGPVLNVFDLWLTPWVASGGPGIPFFLSGLVIFLGVRKFARLLDIKTPLMRLSLVIATTALLGLAVAAVPHASTVLKEYQFDMTNGLLMWIVVSNLFAAALMLRIKHSLSVMYTRALTWFFWSLIAGAANFAIFIMLELGGYHGNSAAYLPLDVLFILNGLIYMKAGYAFTRINDLEPQYQQALNSLDLITYVASLASQPQAIDPIIETVREVSAHILPGQKPSLEDESVLQQVYLSLENYLTTAEPLRHFTKESLRQKISNKFGQPPTGDTTFWSQLPRLEPTSRL